MPACPSGTVCCAAGACLSAFVHRLPVVTAAFVRRLSVVIWGGIVVVRVGDLDDLSGQDSRIVGVVGLVEITLETSHEPSGHGLLAEQVITEALDVALGAGIQDSGRGSRHSDSKPFPQRVYACSKGILGTLVLFINLAAVVCLGVVENGLEQFVVIV